MKPFFDPDRSEPSPRTPTVEIADLFLKRWSPRAFNPNIQIDTITLETVFEAARWSPSCFNEQPWLFLVAWTPEDHATYLSLLTDSNQVWAKDAPVLGFILAKKQFAKNDQPNSWASFDTGAAWMAMTLQARMLGLYTHGMGGFDRERTHHTLNIPKETYDIMCAFALGEMGSKFQLPEKLQSRENPNTDRKPLEQVWHTGRL